MSRHVRVVAGIGVALAAAMAAPLAAAQTPLAAPGPEGPMPTAPRFERTAPGVWVLKIDPETYGGAKGTITFYDEGFVGPGGTGPTDFKVGDGFDVSTPSFVQNVSVQQRDGLTRDPPSTVFADSVPGLFSMPNAAFRDNNMDGQVNLGGFGWTTPPGTKFENMKIDKAGNYWVARRDMHWGFFDSFAVQQGTGPVRNVDTNFNFQPYPLSDAFGVCSSVTTLSPRAFQVQRGHLLFDVAFDVYPNDGEPGTMGADTQVVPGFVARSYGRYVVDVTNPMGQPQRFDGSTTSINHNPITNEMDPRWFQRVSAIGAGVVPTGAWVTGSGPTLRVVPQGTPGARYHRNKFAGFAYLLRGDFQRRIEDLPGVDYDRRQTWSAYPLADALKRPADVRGLVVRSIGRSRIQIEGRAQRAADGPVQLAYTVPGRGGAARQSGARGVATMSAGRFEKVLRVPRGAAKARRGLLVVRYAGDETHRAQSVRRQIRVR